MLRSVRDGYRAFVGAMLHGEFLTIMPYCTPKQEPRQFGESHFLLFERIRPAAIATFAQQGDLAERAAGSAHILLDTDFPAEVARDEHGRTLPSGPIAFLQHSSDAIGLKKGVMLAHTAVLAQVDAYAPLIGLGAGSVVASCCRSTTTWA